MIELRGLHLGNIARSPAESVRPDLWPDHAWVPALGPQALPQAHGAHGLFDLAGSWPAVGVRSAAYPVHTDIYPSPRLDDGIWCMSSNAVGAAAGAGLAANSPSGLSPFSGSSAMTLVACLKLTTVSADRIFIEDGTAYNSNCMFLMQTPANRVQVLLYSGGAYTEAITASGVITAGEWAVVTAKWGLGTTNAGKAEIFAGSLCVRAISTRTITAPLGTGNTRLTFFGRPSISGEIADYAPAAGSALSCILAYGNRALLDSQIQDLHADPILPFRRRQPVYYSVPSGGGSDETPAAMMRAL